MKTGTAVFNLVNLYTVNVEKILDLYQGLKLVVKFYTDGEAAIVEHVTGDAPSAPRASKCSVKQASFTGALGAPHSEVIW